MFEKISKRQIGYRVQAARELKGMTQTKLCKALGLKNRQSISFIENGERGISINELARLTEILDYDTNYFLDPFSVTGEANYSWRASTELEESKLREFELQTAKWIGLLRWLREINNKQTNPLKYCLKINKRSSFEDAIKCGEKLVDFLDLDLIPAKNLIQKIEKQLDIPVFFVDSIENSSAHSISGAACHLVDLGIILINRNEIAPRRYYTLAHELFHVLTWDIMQPEHRESNVNEEKLLHKRIEQLADNFAAGILMPHKSLSHYIDKKLINNTEHLVKVSKKFNVTTKALGWRLYNLKWIDEHMLNILKNKKTIYTQAKKINKFQYDFVVMLHNAITKEILTTNKAAKTLNMSLDQLKELFNEHGLTNQLVTEKY